MFPLTIGLMNNKAGDTPIPPEPTSTIFRLDSRDMTAGSQVFTDRSQNEITITNPSNDTVYSSTESRDPSGVSMNLFASGGTTSLVIPNDQAFAVGTGAMTLEVCIYQNASGTIFPFSNIHDWSTGIFMSTNILRNLSGNSITMDAPIVPTVGAWVHLIWTRDGAGLGYFYVDGVLKEGGYADSRSVVGAFDAFIGKSDDSNCYMDYIRVSDEELDSSLWIMNN